MHIMRNSFSNLHTIDDKLMGINVCVGYDGELPDWTWIVNWKQCTY